MINYVTIKLLSYSGRLFAPVNGAGVKLKVFLWPVISAPNKNVSLDSKLSATRQFSR